MQPQNIWNLIEEDTLKMTVKLKQWEMEVSHTDKTVKRKALKRGTLGIHATKGKDGGLLIRDIICFCGMDQCQNMADVDEWRSLSQKKEL
ncbi:hypothetical protein RRG08_010001 [Elysia crispata]|uniref:Uncharacterized protein n=1 Tax=Elysia crispata TaxID=231223 RepID=A0AAE0YQD1_9GAST|nr:hypothetical protein RRG08_010001 [Elysia crispata]